MLWTHEVTVRQYISFLNAVAATDAHGLFDVESDVVRSGSPGSYVYSALPAREDMPMNFVTLYDAMRFVNWLENGQPDGVQNASTTEDGSYTITPAGIAANSIALNPGADYMLPSEDEWYKAAYYHAGTATYRAYPAGSPSPTGCALPGATPNTANCANAVGDTADVGSYTASPSPYGTFDQGGNVWEWTDEITGLDRRIRGGGFASAVSELAAASSGMDADPLAADPDLGFRVPEPSRLWQLAAGIGALIALARRRR